MKYLVGFNPIEPRMIAMIGRRVTIHCSSKFRITMLKKVEAYFSQANIINSRFNKSNTEVKLTIVSQTIYSFE